MICGGEGQRSPNPALVEPNGMDGMGTVHGKRMPQEQERGRRSPGPWRRKNEGKAQGDPRSGPQRLNEAVGEGASGTPMMAAQVTGWVNGAWVPLVLLRG